MWLGEQITDRGIGNGMSLLIFAGIVVGLPRGVQDLIDKAKNGTWGAITPVLMVGVLVFMILVVAFIVYVERCERRIPVQYAKRVVGRKVMGGQSTHLPLRVNAGGVMPVIFASSLLSLPPMLGYGLKNNRYFGGLIQALGFGEPLYTFSLPTSMCRSCSIPAKSPTTCGSTAALFPAFVRASVRRTTSTRY
jgi:preprotein translocase subunit SecY